MVLKSVRNNAFLQSKTSPILRGPTISSESILDIRHVLRLTLLGSIGKR